MRYCISKTHQIVSTIITAASLTLSVAVTAAPSAVAVSTAKYATSQYQQAVIDTLRDMVQFKTVAVAGLELAKNPEFINFKLYLKQQAQDLGFDYIDYDGVVVISMGSSTDKLGIITHGDVQPADPRKWHQSPFILDQSSQPGKLIARGTEDDKGAIATALYAMKAIKDKGVKLDKTIELIVALTEESDWDPFRAFLTQHTVPQLNITIDSSYPVVVAEKGWNAVNLDFKTKDSWQAPIVAPYISHFSGGMFTSQIPEDATVTLNNVSGSIKDLLQQRALQYPQIKFNFSTKNDQFIISAQGNSAHSSSPQDGLNAIAFLAQLVNIEHWPSNDAGALVNFINQQIGTGIYGKKFGDIAYQDQFMGPMTLAITVAKQTEHAISLNINLRRPVGKTKQLFEQQLSAAINQWHAKNPNVTLDNIQIDVGVPYTAKNAPHVPKLLDVFSHFTGIANPQPIASGGSTNAKLLPSAVSFGPSMPNTKYSGHSEHEFLTVEQLKLNLAMYTAMMIEIGTLK